MSVSPATPERANRSTPDKPVSDTAVSDSSAASPDAPDTLASAPVHRADADTAGFAIHEEEKVKIINRLRRLEGQVRGLQRMVEEERSCKDVLTLLAGVRSALNATADRILVNYLEHCQTEFSSHDDDTHELDVQELVQAVKLARG